MKQLRVWGSRSQLPGVMSVVVCLLAGCVTTPPPPTAAWPAPVESSVVMEPGDSISIKFTYSPELDEEQIIRPDGNVSLQFVGKVPAAGKTPEEFEQQLLALYEEKLKEPEIRVLVTSYNTRPVYVGGEVMRPGPVAMEGRRLTALDAIMKSGGYIKWSAKLRNVVVIRYAENKRYACTIDLRKTLEEPNSDPFYLQPYDIVFVPRTNIEKVDQWVDQYVNKTLGPRSYHGNFNLNKSLDDFDTTYYTNTPVQ